MKRVTPASDGADFARKSPGDAGPLLQCAWGRAGANFTPGIGEHKQLTVRKRS